MRKAALVLATSVAFLLFAVPHSYAGTKKKVQMPTAQSVANGSGTPVKSGTTLSIPGDLQQEYIPADNFSRRTPFKVLPTIDFSIPRTIEHSKGFLKNNAGSIVLGGVIAGMVAGLDWVMDEGSQIQKKESAPIPYNPSYIHWDAHGRKASSPSGAVSAFLSATGGGQICGTNGRQTSESASYFIIRPGGSCDSTGFTVDAWRYGQSCPQGSSFDNTSRSCSTQQLSPLAPSDFSLVDAYVNAQSSDWIKDLIRESCEGSLAPDRCFEDLRDNVSLTGPSTVSGPSTLTTTSGPSGTTTKETKTNFQITYGSDYFIYAPTTTTTTVNPDGTTEVETEEETTEEEAQEEEIDTSIPDLYKPVIDKYDSISSDVSDAQGPGAGITWGPWYSFGGSCTEIEAQLPIIGFWSTNYCPYIYNLVRPVLMFLFVVFTWHYCKEMFQEAIEKGRPV